MEIKEVVSYYVNADSNILEVSFRTIDDSDEVFRSDNITYSLIKEYGYDVETDYLDFFGEDDEDDDEKDESDIELDEHELISFLNEYYLVNPKLIPHSVLY